MIRPLTLSLAVALAALASQAAADDVLDTINEGVAQYKAGRKAEAVQSLEYAANLIRQQKGESMAALLPKPLAGWKVDARDSDTQVTAGAIFGGGVTAQRTYVKPAPATPTSADGDGADARVEITVTTDSPMMQSVMMMLGNPAMLGGSGGKMERIGGERALVKYDAQDKSGEVTLAVANRFLVQVRGSNAALADIKAYTAGIDFKKLAAMP
jgi:hypothetical protein